MRELYYRETDQIDCNLYHHMPWRPRVWEYLGEAQAVDFPPLLSATEIDQWRRRTLDWFSDPQHEPKVRPQHITDERVAAFIQQAVEYVNEWFAAWDVGMSMV